MPQIVMLNHAAKVNGKRMEARIERDKNKRETEDKDPVVMNGKRVSEMNTAELATYMGDTGDVVLTVESPVEGNIS
jgi:hypothetical protein